MTNMKWRSSMRKRPIAELQTQRVLPECLTHACAPQLTTDDVALIWLHDATTAPKIAAALQGRTDLGVAKVLVGAALTAQVSTF